MLANLVRAHTRAAMSASARAPLAAVQAQAQRTFVTRLLRPAEQSRINMTARRAPDAAPVPGSRGYAMGSYGDAPPNPPSQTIFLGNLPYSADEADVKEAIADFSNVVDVRLSASLSFLYLFTLMSLIRMNPTNNSVVYRSRLGRPFSWICLR